jgi:myosin-5
MNHAKDGWLAVQLVEQRGEVVTVKTLEEEHYDLPANAPLKAALPSSLIGYANLLSLGELHEGAILHTLRTRYAQDAIYSNISTIVLSINPYKQLTCYGPSQIALFRSMLVKGAQMQEGAPPAGTGNMAIANTPLPPHVYALADAAYGSLQRDGHNQAVVISGESGAGSLRHAYVPLSGEPGRQQSSCSWLVRSSVWIFAHSGPAALLCRQN